MSPIRLLADKHAYQVSRHLPDTFELELYNPDFGIPAEASTFDALLVRTVTKVNEQTLPVTGRLRWVGTASAGTDHIDTAYLAKRGIKTGSAAGCNARAVAEYVITLLLFTAWKRGWDPTQQSVGIVGVGHVGSAVDAALQRLGITTIGYDPPRSIREPEFRSSTLAEVLDADILTLHLPYTDAGDYRTRKWLSFNRLAYRDRTLLIQASRGGTADESAILRLLEEGRLKDAIIDVWQSEPDFDVSLADRAIVATPHTAGHSEQAKIAATCIALDSMFAALGIDYRSSTNSISQAEIPAISAPFDGKKLIESERFSLSESLLADFLAYDSALRKVRHIQEAAERKKRFRELRTKTPYRNEYNYLNKSLLDDPTNELLRYLVL